MTSARERAAEGLQVGDRFTLARRFLETTIPFTAMHRQG